MRLRSSCLILHFDEIQTVSVHTVSVVISFDLRGGIRLIVGRSVFVIDRGHDIESVSNLDQTEWINVVRSDRFCDRKDGK